MEEDDLRKDVTMVEELSLPLFADCEGALFLMRYISQTAGSSLPVVTGGLKRTEKNWTSMQLAAKWMSYNKRMKSQ